MKSKLYLSNKIEVRKSNIHGWGVFAKENIPKDYIVEECHYTTLPKNVKETDELWRYSWKNFDSSITPFGWANIYNSSKSDKTANIIKEYDKKNKLLFFKTITEIQKNDELLHNYYKSVLYYELKIK